ncbi:DUF2147 domain-containing protein [Acetobacter suratthaniensis]|uniref:DUF2147 domain-containing protein n=2 Tax=Acetobacter suratthaniensis TaxID=1502841 RepID=A0ABS3LIG6_9PROT|nr:DUF2147 domain-containing protein [Acetobacter suratthaniensis]MBO1327399.1 DUF2147 domain-containing protein [Acetobacter suratthaniensis]MCX2564988.1 DUF2147 domain-containing protein [Acetobacter suratthaniensis]
MNGQGMVVRSGRRLGSIARGWMAIFVFCALVLGVSLQPASAATDEKLMGYWLSQDHDGVFLIQQCGDVVCGRLVGMRYDGTDVPRGHDGKVECNLMMLTGFRTMQDNARKMQGHILDPDTGHVYDAQIWNDGPDVLKLRGYLGLPLFGQTQTWTRYTGPGMGPMCKMP